MIQSFINGLLTGIFSYFLVQSIICGNISLVIANLACLFTLVMMDIDSYKCIR